MNNKYDQIRSFIDIISSGSFVSSFSLWSKLLADLIWEAKVNSKLITLFGNGGSAADSQHWSAELMCTYKNRTRSPIAAIALTTDTSLLTAWSNDFDFDTVFSRQIDALDRINGLSIGMSTSGKSKNVLIALANARSRGAKTVLISGSSVKMNEMYDLHVVLPTRETAAAQTITQMLYHEVCQNLDQR